MLRSGKLMRLPAFGLAAFCITLLTVWAQTSAVPPAVPDPKIAAALKQISAERIQESIQQLVSFGTRLTLSAQDSESISSGRGIAAAREWIRSEFERYSKECGGCLEVKLDRFTEGPMDRIPSPTELVNVYAIQRGTDPENAKRVYVVGGHYDSRPSDTLDTKADAPGANDDGSGTTVAIEAARVLSKSKFSATIVYVAFAGEEQGLNGSRHFAKMAKAEGWNIEGVLSNDIVGGDKSPGQDTNIVRVFSDSGPNPWPAE